MKNIMIWVLALLAATTLQAQHLEYKGVPIDGQQADFVKQLSELPDMCAFGDDALITFWRDKMVAVQPMAIDSFDVFGVKVTVFSCTFDEASQFITHFRDSLSQVYEIDSTTTLPPTDGLPSYNLAVHERGAIMISGKKSEEGDDYLTEVMYMDDGNTRMAMLISMLRDNAENEADSTVVVDDEEESADASQAESYEDVDYYMAETTTAVNLRQGPGTGYKILARIPRGGAVLVSSASKGQAFRRVLYEGDAGYVSAKYLAHFTKLKVDEEGNLTLTGRTAKPTADIEVENRTDRYMTMTLGSLVYKFKPHEKRTLTGIRPGRYKNTASSTNVNPYVSMEKLEAGCVYCWVFYIRTRIK